MNSLSYELVSSEDYEGLPDDPEDSFVTLESICQKNMTRMIDENTTNGFDLAVRMQYAATMTAYAAECGFHEIVNSYPKTDNYEDFARFSLIVKGCVARIRFRNRANTRSSSVLLTQNTKTKIGHYISRLENTIRESNLASRQKEKLEAKLLELRSELNNPRLNYSRAFALLALTVATIGSATTIVAEGPAAVTHILRLIGIDQQSEEDAAQRLAPPPRVLPAPSTATPPISTVSWDMASRSDGDALDDEIPF